MNERRSFFDEIARNKLKSTALLFLFSGVIIALGYVLGLIWFPQWPFAGMFLAFFIGVIYMAFAWVGGDKIILSTSRARPVKKEEDPYLVNTVEAMAIAAGLSKPPRVYIINETSMNAFATGRDPNHAVIAVTSGLRKRMNRLELEGVIAHEMSHIKNYDIRVMMLATVLLGIVVLISDLLLRSFLYGGSGRDRKNNTVFLLVGLALAILAPIIAQLLRLAISRKREFLADATAVQLTRNPSGLASALKKIRDDHDKVVDIANKATAHLYIENPLRHKKSWLNNLFSTHPDINERIARLEAM
ncbi:zinc metalloprotease HtpX [Candidatus Woesearchaeota archaeon]|nr:MAG: zinc metalloprotease HtpX [Candidatus Woesearchaeota archaeon]